MAQMEYTNFEALEDKYIGKVGTPRRDAYEAGLKEEIHAYHIGEAIKAARTKKGLTQQQLGDLMGVQRPQICKIESGRNLTFNTVAKAFKALGIPAELNAGGVRLALW